MLGETGIGRLTMFTADENPVWVANRVAQFLALDTAPPAAVNLSSLADRVTLTVGYFGTLGNLALGTQSG